MIAAFLLVGTPVAAVAQEAALPDVVGIYVNGQLNVLPPNVVKGGNGKLAQAIGATGVDGVLIDLNWTDLSSEYGQYDWSYLDYMAGLAIAANKKFEIAIITGNSTPAWVFDQENGYGAQSATFQYIQGGKIGATCQSLTIPLPWDQNYHKALADLLRGLKQHLQQNNWYENLTMLRITGINTLTDELRLPADNTGKNGCEANNLNTWQKLGYSPARVRVAWRQILRIYGRIFPEKVFNVALITDGGFPNFTSTKPSKPSSDTTLGNNTTTQLVKIAGQLLPGQIAIQSNGLTIYPSSGTAKSPDPATIKDARKANAILGWQTNEWCYLTAACTPSGATPTNGTTLSAACGGARSAPITCINSTYSNMLTNGIYPAGTTGETKPFQAQYLELFAPDILAFPPAVMQAHNELTVSGAPP
jgi:hypothetical protein